MTKKIKKLSLKKETITNLSDFEQSRVLAGGLTDYLDQYFTGMNSRMDPANCVNGYTASDRSYCYCTNGKNTCISCANTCNTDILPGGCAYTQDMEVCRTH